MVKPRTVSPLAGYFRAFLSPARPRRPRTPSHPQLPSIAQSRSGAIAELLVPDGEESLWAKVGIAPRSSGAPTTAARTNFIIVSISA
jgi:hypothetical protein